MSGSDTRLIRAAYTAETLIVYQAYSPQIADAAVRAGTFVPPFSRDRMTWIKPSFGWMMHRSGWASKPGQERVLAIEITRGGFSWALAHSCLSQYKAGQHGSPQVWAALRDASPVRVQWDPDRSLTGNGSRTGQSRSACPARPFTATATSGSARSPTSPRPPGRPGS